MNATQTKVNANEFIGTAAKMGALLQYVFETGERPFYLNPGTLQVWDALVFLDLVRTAHVGRAWLTPGGKCLLELASRGEL